MKILRAEHLGMCFGVRDAIQLALDQAQIQPLTVLGDLVHNETVLAELRARGIQIAQQVGTVETEAVMITAHGASEKALNGVRERGLNVTEATCPLVRVAHRAVAQLVSPLVFVRTAQQGLVHENDDAGAVFTDRFHAKEDEERESVTVSRHGRS